MIGRVTIGGEPGRNGVIGAAGGQHRDLVGLPGGAAGGAGGGEHGPDGGVVGVERGVAGGLVGTGEGPGLSGPGAAAGAGAGEPGWGEPALQVRGPKPPGGESIPVEERDSEPKINLPIRLSFGEGFSPDPGGVGILIDPSPSSGIGSASFSPRAPTPGTRMRQVETAARNSPSCPSLTGRLPGLFGMVLERKELHEVGGSTQQLG